MHQTNNPKTADKNRTESFADDTKHHKRGRATVRKPAPSFHLPGRDSPNGCNQRTELTTAPTEKVVRFQGWRRGKRPCSVKKPRGERSSGWTKDTACDGRGHEGVGQGELNGAETNLKTTAGASMGAGRTTSWFTQAFAGGTRETAVARSPKTVYAK